MTLDNQIVKVSHTSRPSAVGAFVAGRMVEGVEVLEVRAMGITAVAVATKAVAIAVGFAREDGLTLNCTPKLIDVNDGDGEKAAVAIIVERRTA